MGETLVGDGHRVGASMATKGRQTVKKIKFELTRSGIAGIGVVMFCIFLWMFLLGVWTGQSLLVPAARSKKTVVRPAATSPKVVVKPLVIEAGVSKKIKQEH